MESTTKDQPQNITAEAIAMICERLSERTATLFLGAGINHGVRNDRGDEFPLGQGLSDWIAHDLLEDSNLSAPLTESSEMAKYRLGAESVNKYIYDRFATFKPGTAHLSLVQLPWDVIYTTNYDLLVETAAVCKTLTAAGSIQQVFSTSKDLGAFSESDIPYYKLHGSIDYANTAEGRLILTKEDYRYYETHRKPLFKRLQRDLLSRTFLFVGYSLSDDNFRAILDDCLSEVGTSNLPLSYAIRDSFTPVEEVYWREKYNIQLLRADGAEFLDTLKTSWFAEQRAVTPLEQRKSKEYLQFDNQTRFPKVAESFYQVDPSYCTGSSDPLSFFQGAEPSWNDIKNKVMPQRDAYWPLLEAMFPELVDPTAPPTVYLVTGAAGTGKTTLVHSVALNLSNDFKLPVLIHVPGTPLDARVLRPLVKTDDPRRIVVVIRHAAEQVKELERFLNEARQQELPLTLILEERKNQWNIASSSLKSRLSVAEYELGALSEVEIQEILKALTAHNALGKLTDTPLDYQIQHFRTLAHKELLVALRELTTEGSFDDIIRDEFEMIPSQVAKEAYTYIAALGQLDMPIRYEVIVHLLKLRYDQLNTLVFQPTEGILISGEVSGRSRHDLGFRLSTRHPVIASVIFAASAPDDQAKLDILNNLLAFLDPGHREDRRLLDAIVRRKELVSTLSSAENRRAIYERLEKILPANPFVLQHRSVLERSLDNPQLAVSFARKALNLDKNNPTIANTLGLALELEARSTRDILRHQALLSEASRLFDDGIKRDPSDAYGYLGKYQVMKQNLEREPDIERRAALQASMFSLIDEAFEATDESDVIAHVFAQQQKDIGQSEEAIAILQGALKKDPTNHRIRDRWVQYEEKRDPHRALEIAMEGAQLDATAWRLHRHIARLQQVTGASTSSIRGHFEAAIRHNKGNLNLHIEYGAYLFKNELYNEAKRVFSEAVQLPVGVHKKREVQQMWKDSRKNSVVFTGKIKSIEGASGYAISIPTNFEAFFWRSYGRVAGLREGQSITFTVAFNAFGAQARDIQKS